MAHPAAGPEKIELLAVTLARRVAILPAVKGIRQRGLKVAVELADTGASEQVALAAGRRGLRVRVVRQAVVVTSPASISDGELCRLVAILASSIAEASVGRMPAAA